MMAKNIRLLLVPILLATMIIVSVGCTEIKKDKIILAHGMHPSHPVSKAMEFMAERLEEKSDGKLSLTLYPNRQLGSERELLELVQIGTVDIIKVSGANLETFVPEFQVLSLPYLFKDKEHLENVLWGEVGKELLLSGTEQNFRGLTYYDAGLRSFYTKERPVTNPDDLEGLKIRVQESKMAIDFIKALEGSATPISYGELYTALQSGIVDGAENNPPSLYSSRHYEVSGYYSLTEHTGVPDILLTGTRVWGQLTDQQRQWIQEAAEESAEYQRKIWVESVKESMSEVKEYGMEVLEVDREPFVKMVQPMYKKFEQNNPEIYQWVEKIRKVK